MGDNHTCDSRGTGESACTGVAKAARATSYHHFHHQSRSERLLG